MLPTKHYFEKYKKDRPPFSLRRYNGPISPHLCLTMRVISSVHLPFCGSWKQRLLLKARQYFKKLDSLRYKVVGVWNNITHNLRKNHTILILMTLTQSVPLIVVFKVIICILRKRSCVLFKLYPFFLPNNLS